MLNPQRGPPGHGSVEVAARGGQGEPGDAPRASGSKIGVRSPTKYGSTNSPYAPGPDASASASSSKSALPDSVRSHPVIAPEGLNRLVDTAYEARSVATVDQLLHRAHVWQTSGESVRLSRARAGQGVTSLN